MAVQEAIDLGLEVVCDPDWAVDNPAEAKALYRARIIRKLGLEEPAPILEALDKAIARERAFRKRSEESRKGSKPREKRSEIPVVDGERMVLLMDLVKDPEVNSHTVGCWCTKNLIRCELVGRRRYVLESEVRARIASFCPSPPVIDGEELVHSMEVAEETGLLKRAICSLAKQEVIRHVVRQEGCHRRLWVSRQDVVDYLERGK